jgi:hypothetical protein
MYLKTNSNMGWYLFSEDISEVERDDGVRDLTFLFHGTAVAAPPLH